MRILYLLGSLHRGGAETLILDIFRNANIFEIDFYCLHRFNGGVFQNEFYASGAKLQHLPYKPLLLLSYLSKLRKYLKNVSPQIIHAHQPIDAFYALIASYGLGIPVVQTLHSYDFETRRFAKIALIVSLRLARINLFVSNYQKNYYQKKYKLRKESPLVFYNSVSFEKLMSKTHEEKSKFQIRKELNLSDHTLLIISVGNFTEVRNQLILCRFAALLKNKYSDFHLVFVGAKVDRFPEYYDRCIKYCQDNSLQTYITFLGSRNDVPQLLKQSDVFLYYTNYDTFGISVVEAMAAEIPVFVNDWDVMKEISDNGQIANLYDSNDLNDLIEKFMHFTQNKAEYKVKSAKAKQYVTSKFSIDNYMSELKQIYSDITKC